MPVFKSLLLIKMHVIAIISMLTTPPEGLLLTQIPAQDSDTCSHAGLSIWQSPARNAFLTRQNLTQHLKLI